MILQEERSYERANARWWARKEAKWDLQDTYGPLLWRIRAPRRARGLYRWGHLTTATDLGAVVSTDPPTPATPEVGGIGTSPVPAAVPPRPTRPHQRGRSRRPARGRVRADFADFWAAAAELLAEGKPVDRTLIMCRLRGRGLSLANDRADEYLTRLGDPEAA